MSASPERESLPTAVPAPRLLRVAREWRDPPAVDPATVANLSAAIGAPAVVAEVLVRRGHADPESAKGYLRPRLDHLTDPWTLPDMDAAVARLRAALTAGETVLVHGDYDVDGVCGAALLGRGLRALGVKAQPFVPHRLADGYDLGPAGLAAARAQGARVILTCDCGTNAEGAIHDARSSGIDVVVTDHHRVGPALPAAVALVNPARPDSRYGGTLCGTGVAYKLLEALFEAEGRPRAALYKFLDLVAIATVADQVPLVGESRAFVRFGLRVLRETRNPGLRALLELNGLAGRRLSARHAAFIFGPRLNAVGRMGAASRAVELLLARNAADARPLAELLERENRIRQDVDRRTFREAMQLLESRYDPDREYALVLASERWHPGVIGIVASRVVEEVFRPTVLIALCGERARGSGRSIPRFHLYEALQACARHLERFGGHQYAAGLEIRPDNIGAFREAFQEEARSRLRPEDLVPILEVDAELDPARVDAGVWKFVRSMAPFGIGNPTPLFLARRARVAGPVEVVGPGHLRLRLGGENGTGLAAIGFDMAESARWVLPGVEVTAVYRLQEARESGPLPEAVLLGLRPGGP